jgi:hypothetical protein
MFTWICPQCGREVPPAYTDCPDCAKTDKTNVPVGEAGPPTATPPSAATPPEYVPPQPAHPQQPSPPQQQPQQPQVGQVHVRPYQPPPPPVPHGGLPTWLLTVLFAFAFLGLGAGIYWLVGYFRGSNTTPTAAVESPAAKPGAKVNPYQKYIEISGVRFLEDPKKKPEVKFVIINHSGADISGLTGNVTIWGRTRRSEEEAAGSFQFTTSIGPWESKDMTVPLATKLKMIELPDWQNTSTDVQITGPTF